MAGTAIGLKRELARVITRFENESYVMMMAAVLANVPYLIMFGLLSTALIPIDYSTSPSSP
jgi:hypothetical protein